jgi:hypothetical protein
VYLVFNEGYAATSGDALVRRELCAEAIRLGRLLRGLLPAASEAAGLLGLMLLHDSRRAARLDARGDLVTLEEQDRARWDRAQITEGQALAEEAVRRGGGGFYALQAAIAALHAQAARPQDTDWPQIAALYALLLRLHPSPVVALNHAAAVAMGERLERGLRLVEQLEATGELDGYHLLPAAKADILRRLGRTVGSGHGVRARPGPRHPTRRAPLPGAAAARGPARLTETRHLTRPLGAALLATWSAVLAALLTLADASPGTLVNPRSPAHAALLLLYLGTSLWWAPRLRTAGLVGAHLAVTAAFLILHPLTALGRDGTFAVTGLHWCWSSSC